MADDNLALQTATEKASLVGVTASTVFTVMIAYTQQGKTTSV